MDIQIPKLPALPRLPAIAVSRRQALIAAGAAVAVIAAAFSGWTLFTEHAKEQQVATFANHIAASESDLSRVYEKISAHMRSVPKNPAPAGADASMRELAAIGDYGRAVTAYHRQVIGADTVPEAYTGAQSAYIRALDNLNRAFSLWSGNRHAQESGRSVEGIRGRDIRLRTGAPGRGGGGDPSSGLDEVLVRDPDGEAE
jgi:hypothetical protein